MIGTNPPLGIKAFRDAGLLEIRWDDAHVDRIPFRTLRAECPCAGCVDEITGIRTLDVDAIPPNIAPVKIELSGNYALKVQWSDGHTTGLYTWVRLARLCHQATSSLGSRQDPEELR